MAAQAQATQPTAVADQLSYIQSWFESWLTPCCKAETADAEISVVAQDQPDSAKTGSVAEDLVAKKDVVAKYKIDNSVLKSAKRPGVAYRASKDQKDTLKLVARFGEIVEGVDEGGDWLRVGEHYLPMKYKGMPVITPLKEEETFSPKTGVPPSPARATANATSPVASTQKVDNIVEEPSAETTQEKPSEGAAEDAPFAKYFEANFPEPLAMGGFQDFYAKFRNTDEDAVAFAVPTPQTGETDACAGVVEEEETFLNSIPEPMKDIILVEKAAPLEEMPLAEAIVTIIPEPVKEISVVEKAGPVEDMPASKTTWRHRPSVGTWVHSLPFAPEVEA